MGRKKGFRHTEETKKKIGLANKGKQYFGKSNPFYGRTHSEEARGKNGDAHRGENSPNWKGGKPKCKCGKTISYESTYCIKCAGQAFSGENSPVWKGGISKDKEHKNWHTRNRRFKLRGAEGYHTLQEWQALKKKYDYMCLCCKKQEPEIKLTEDHIIPITKGGDNYIANIQPLCQSCNSSKYTTMINYKKSFSLQVLNNLI